MLFTLEALDAGKGDALLLHFGTIATPELIVIDGGPSGVYRRVLKPRLEELRASRGENDRLTIRLAMVSHIDDDHINGILYIDHLESHDQLIPTRPSIDEAEARDFEVSIA